MAMFKGLEGLVARMEDDATPVDETTVDVEVRVAEEVEEAATVIEEATSIVADAEASDAAAEEVESLESFIASVKKYGVTQQGMELMNMGGALSAFSGIALPAAESLDGAGRNHDAAQMVIAACEGAISKAWEAVKKFFINLWNKIKTMFAWLVNKLSSMESAVKRSKESINDVTALDPAKVKAKELKTLKVADYTKYADAIMASVAAFQDFDKTGKLTGSADLTALGLAVKDGKIENSEKGAIEVQSMKLSASGWTLEFAKGDAFTQATKLTALARALPKSAAAAKTLCDAGIAGAESMAKSGAEEADKENLKKLREGGASIAKLAGKLAGKCMTCPRVYITACAALKACAK